MIYLDIKKVCNNIGIEDPRRWLVKNGFNHVTAGRLMNNTQDSIKYATMEKLCLLLNCTPNELLSFQPNSNSTVAASHPIQKLKHVPKEASITGRLKALSPEKIKEVQEFLDGMAGH